MLVRYAVPNLSATMTGGSVLDGRWSVRRRWDAGTAPAAKACDLRYSGARAAGTGRHPAYTELPAQLCLGRRRRTEAVRQHMARFSHRHAPPLETSGAVRYGQAGTSRTSGRAAPRCPMGSGWTAAGGLVDRCPIECRTG